MVMKVKVLQQAGRSPETFQAHPGQEIEPYLNSNMLLKLDQLWEYGKLSERALPGLEELCTASDGNKYIVPADVEQVIRANFDRREPKPQKVVQNNADADKDITSEILALLREQLETKDREIERLHKQVDDLQKINADMVKAVRELNTIQAMQLTDGSERTPEERPNQERTESEVREQSTVEPRKKSLWDRIKSVF